MKDILTVAGDLCWLSCPVSPHISCHLSTVSSQRKAKKAPKIFEKDHIDKATIKQCVLAKQWKVSDCQTGNVGPAEQLFHQIGGKNSLKQVQSNNDSGTKMADDTRDVIKCLLKSVGSQVSQHRLRTNTENVLMEKSLDLN